MEKESAEDFFRMREEAAEPFRKMVMGAMESWMAGEPVWLLAKIIEQWGPEFEDWLRRYSRSAELPLSHDVSHDVMRHMAAFAVREEFVGRYGFAIPCAELISSLAKSRIVLEVGAGSGYMTKLMRNHKINVVGSDLVESGVRNYGFITAEFDPGQLKLDAVAAVQKFHMADTIFCSWPSFGEDWFLDALKVVKRGQRVIAIRESACATEETWEYFETWFDEREQISIPMFSGLHDWADVRVRK